MGRAGQVAEQSWVGSVYLEKCFDIQGFAKISVVHFVAKLHAVNSS